MKELLYLLHRLLGAGWRLRLLLLGGCWLQKAAISGEWHCQGKQAVAQAAADGAQVLACSNRGQQQQRWKAGWGPTPC